MRHLEFLIPGVASTLLRDQVRCIRLPGRNRVEARPIGNRDPQPVARRFDAEKPGLLRGQRFHRFRHLPVAVVARGAQGSEDHGKVRRRGRGCNRHRGPPEAGKSYRQECQIITKPAGHLSTPGKHLSCHANMAPTDHSFHVLRAIAGGVIPGVQRKRVSIRRCLRCHCRMGVTGR